MLGLVVGNSQGFLRGRKWHVFLPMTALVEHTNCRVSSVVPEKERSVYFQ